MTLSSIPYSQYFSQNLETSFSLWEIAKYFLFMETLLAEYVEDQWRARIWHKSEETRLKQCANVHVFCQHDKKTNWEREI